MWDWHYSTYIPIIKMNVENIWKSYTDIASPTKHCYELMHAPLQFPYSLFLLLVSVVLWNSSSTNPSLEIPNHTQFQTLIIPLLSYTCAE